MHYLLGSIRMNHNLNKNKNNHLITVASTTTTIFFTMIIIFASSTTTIITPVAASTTTSNTPTDTTSSSGVELSPQPVYQRRPSTTGVTQINQTHIASTFSANGTLTLPNPAETINTTSNGSAITSLTTQSAIAKETIMTEDGETVTATFYEIVKLTAGGGDGIAIAVLHTNSTDRLAPLNGMILIGTDYMHPIGNGLTTYWEWIPTPPSSPIPPTTTMEESPPSPTNTTMITTNATTTTATDTNATAADEQGGGEEQTATIPAPLLE
jgi:hypothetical protein